MNKRVIAKEWIIFIAGFSFGILPLPLILIGIERIGEFYKALLVEENFIAWLIVSFGTIYAYTSC